VPFLNRILLVLCFSSNAFAQASYFAAAAPLTNTHYDVAGHAADQQLVATASLPNATMIVWNENGDSYLGIRARNGSWRERLFLSGERAIAAAGEIVITENEAGWMATWIDADGAAVVQSARLASFRARGVAVANDAVVAGEQDGNVLAVHVMRDGSVAEVATLGVGEDPAIATDGTGFLAVWETPVDTIEATRLDGTNFVVFDVAAEDPAVAFNGRDYVVVWRGGQFLRARRVAANGVPVDEYVQISRADGEAPHSIALARVGDGVGLTWFDGRSQLALYDYSSGWTVRTARGVDASATAAPRLVELPDQRPAFLQSAAGAQTAAGDDAPHYGSARVTMSVGDAVPASAPDAPVAAVSKSGSRLRVAWTAPGQPVNGYRAEVRINDSPWLEYDGWTDAGITELQFEPRRSGTYQVRLRAFGDGGASAYSEPVQVEVIVGGRRRSVR
jgi:hypothetical protein